MMGDRIDSATARVAVEVLSLSSGLESDLGFGGVNGRAYCGGELAVPFID
jgi:hypothetical protein